MTKQMIVADVLGHVAERIFDDPIKQKTILDMPFMQVPANNATVMSALIELEGMVEDVLNEPITDAARKNLGHLSDDLHYEQMQLYNDNANEEAFSFVNVEEGVYGLG